MPRSVTAKPLTARPLSARLATLAALLPAWLVLTAAAPAPTLKPIDLQKYAGRWYEVARLYNRTEEDCIGGDVNYVPSSDGGYRVTDTCVRSGGRPPKVYHPSMRILDPGTNAKFRLTFFPFVWKDYWILDYATDDSWLILGEATGKYLWLFSRTPDLAAHRATLVARAKALGYDVNKLVYDRAD